MDKAEINYNDLKDKLKSKGNSKVEDLILALMAEIEELKSVAIDTNTKYVVTRKGSGSGCEIHN